MSTDVSIRGSFQSSNRGCSQDTLGPKLNKFPIKLPFIKQNEDILNSSTKKSKLLTVVFSTVRTDRVSMVLDRATCMYSYMQLYPVCRFLREKGGLKTPKHSNEKGK